MARQELDQMIQGCGVLGHNLTNRALYNQWPLPTDPALALSVTAVTTFVASPTGAPAKGSGGLALAPGWAGLKLAVAVAVGVCLGCL